MLHLWTALLPAELECQPLAKSTVVVIDVLRATSTIITALASGGRSVLPVRTVEAARKLKSRKTILAGERQGLPPAGFDRGNSPLEFLNDVSGKDIVLTTSNGTAALELCRPAKRVYCASFLNVRAVVNALAAAKTPIGLVCAGDCGVVSLEDTVCAGMIAASLATRHKYDIGLNDATVMAIALAGTFPLVLPMLRNSSHGRDLLELGLGNDLEFISGQNKYDLVPAMRRGVIYPF